MIVNLKNQNWTLITIDDLAFLKSKSILEIIQVLLRTIEFKYVILDSIDGSGEDWVIHNLQNDSNTIMNLSNFLEILSKVKQFEWGDFFLFKEFPSHWNNPPEEKYPYVVNQSDTTIRAVDNQYIYVYTPYKEIVDAIKNNYVIESIKTDSLNKLDYPE